MSSFGVHAYLRERGHGRDPFGKEPGKGPGGDIAKGKKKVIYLIS